MMKSKEAFKIEQKLKDNISLGFFEHGSHSGMDLEFYEAYSEVKSLRMLLEAYEKEIQEVAEDIKNEIQGGEGG